MAGYGSDEGLAGWVASQGLQLPAGAQALEVLRQVGSDYVDAAYAGRLACSRKTGGWEQEREWPRTGHRVGGQVVPPDLIPAAWVNASYRAAYLHATTEGGWATGNVDPNRVTRREKVDVIEREFFAPGEAGGAASAAGVTADAMINAMVGPWLCSNARRLDSLLRVI